LKDAATRERVLASIVDRLPDTGLAHNDDDDGDDDDDKPLVDADEKAVASSGSEVVKSPLANDDEWQSSHKRKRSTAATAASEKRARAKLLHDVDVHSLRKFNVLLTSYDMIVKTENVFGKFEFESLIVDEAHRLKGGVSSKLFQNLTRLNAQVVRLAACALTCAVVQHRVLLTGTPLQNTLKELFHLMKFLVGALRVHVSAACADVRVTVPGRVRRH
jgi:SNF2 family DNA or RNA helicase